MINWANVAIGLIPVFIFLAALVFLDSYKLVRFRSILIAIVVGSIVAGVGVVVNLWLMQMVSVNASTYQRYISPVIEEILKAVYLVYLIKAKKVGFMVDAAVFGFAVGAGFAFIENIYYLKALGTTNALLWIIRGVGTAALHGATMVIFGIISKSLTDRRRSDALIVFFPGLCLAIGIHSLFNHFIIPPVWTTIILLVVLPVVIVFVFDRSEKATRVWLGKGMDADIELLEMITTGRIGDSPVGIYLQTLKEKFPGEIVADMLCLLHIHCELSLGAKGILLMRQAGLDPAGDPEIKAKFEELKYLESSLGKTGLLAIHPVLQTSSHDLWQHYMLGK
jgi:RsiW-degrading membrane proteinase PrsW (M82 family)